MKPDNDHQHPGSAADSIERAHLREPQDTSHTMFTYDAPVEFAGFLQRFWVPVWSVPTGQVAPQKVLQYPVCLLVVTGEYARFYGVVSGLSTTTLSGQGWAVGLSCTPAAGFLIAGRSVHRYTDRHVDISEVMGEAGCALVNKIRRSMAEDPHGVEAHHSAMGAYADALRRFLPVDDDGLLVNRITNFVESNHNIIRVAQLCQAFNMSERSLQRLLHRRVGLTPKWLIQRRRLHEAVDRLRSHSTTMALVAADLGYADEAHFNRDFSRVAGITPARFAATHRR